MTRPGAAGARFRQRKLSTKQALQIVREDQVENADSEQQRNVPKVETGVEKAEEIEHHLQAAISASQAAAVGGTVAQIYIPTPVTKQKTTIKYDSLYPLRFQQPATYIRFSSTVEESCGVQYCMTRADDEFLKSLNQTRPPSARCTEDDFEMVMDFFEQHSSSSQPFAAVDNAPAIAFEEMIQSPEFPETVEESARPFAKEIYEHWKACRIRRGNRPLMLQLKVETNQDTDDGDPYVCFRRREVRQVRKTRGRDAQSIEKLKKLRKELEDARKLIAMVRQRELSKRDILAVEKSVFEQRQELKAMKRKLGIRGDDEDLVHQKPLKKKTVDQSQAQRASGPQLRLSLRPDGRSAESDLTLLQDTLREKENEIQKEMNTKFAEHRAWLDRHLDLTRTPLSPTSRQTSTSKFVVAVTEYLPTPPQSEASESPRDTGHLHPFGDSQPSDPRDEVVDIRYSSPPESESRTNDASFRRRIGRGGRLMIDRRGMRLQSTEGIDPMVLDRFKFDRDDDDDLDDEVPTYAVDPSEKWSMHYRASMVAHSRDLQAQRSAQANSIRPPST